MLFRSGHFLKVYGDGISPYLEIVKIDVHWEILE